MRTAAPTKSTATITPTTPPSTMTARTTTTAPPAAAAAAMNTRHLLYEQIAVVATHQFESDFHVSLPLPGLCFIRPLASLVPLLALLLLVWS